MKGYLTLLILALFLCPLAKASGSQAEAGADHIQTQAISPLPQSAVSDPSIAQRSPRIKRYKLRFRKAKNEKLTKVRIKRHQRFSKWTKQFWNKRAKQSWNKRANLVIIISWAITIIGFLSFLLSLIGGTPAMFTFGLIAMMIGGAGMLAGLIWGLA